MSSSAALAAGDAAVGKTVFAGHCAVCHAIEAGQNKVGPSLAGIVGSKSGSVPGFDFSTAMKEANVTWDDAAGRNAALAGDGTSNITDFSSGSHTRLFNTPGTYGFHCTIHAPGMTGTLTVQ